MVEPGDADLLAVLRVADQHPAQMPARPAAWRKSPQSPGSTKPITPASFSSGCADRPVSSASLARHGQRELGAAAAKFGIGRAAQHQRCARRRKLDHARSPRSRPRRAYRPYRRQRSAPSRAPPLGAHARRQHAEPAPEGDRVGLDPGIVAPPGDAHVEPAPPAGVSLRSRVPRSEAQADAGAAAQAVALAAEVQLAAGEDLEPAGRIIEAGGELAIGARRVLGERDASARA